MDEATSVASGASALAEQGFELLAGNHSGEEGAWAAAWDAMNAAVQVDGVRALLGMSLEQVGAFVIPPPETPQRDFQALHVDFGVPFGTGRPVDVARYTALFVDPAVAASGAQTRLVPLRGLSYQRDWGVPDALAAAVLRHLGPDGAEGILGRLIEAVDGTSDLPAKSADGFLCGLEFATLAAEEAFFAAHGLDLAAAETRVVIEPGQVLVFDNLSCAHGRVGKRRARELHQLCVGVRDLPPTGQRAVLEQFLGRLAASDLRRNAVE